MEGHEDEADFVSGPGREFMFLYSVATRPRQISTNMASRIQQIRHKETICGNYCLLQSSAMENDVNSNLSLPTINARHTGIDFESM